MAHHRISGIPVTEADGKLGRHPDQPRCALRRQSQAAVSELMTKDNLATASIGVRHEEARHLLHQRRIEKLLVVDDNYKCVGLITVKDMKRR